jgi:signal transduction histidine kinase
MWFTVVSVVFLCLVITMMIMVPVVLVGLRRGLIPYANSSKFQIFSIAAVGVLSVVIGTALSAVFGRAIVQPIRELSRATKEVAKGDFTVRLPEYDETAGELSEIGQLNRDFNKMVKELGGIEMLRNDFVANVSHEFKTPIASIEGCAVLLQDDSLSPEERKQYSAIIAASAKRLTSMTTNILQLSKLENQEILPNQEEFSLDEQIRQSILMLEPQWSGKELELDIDLTPVRFFGSSELLPQVWSNLISNAVKFTDRGGSIGVYLKDEGESVTVTVKDNGTGMDEETQKRIFDKFYQGSASHSTEGNGLGLALAKRIVELSGGTITVKSAPNEGSEFTVVLKRVK